MTDEDRARINESRARHALPPVLEPKARRQRRHVTEALRLVRAAEAQLAKAAQHGAAVVRPGQTLAAVGDQLENKS